MKAEAKKLLKTSILNGKIVLIMAFRSVRLHWPPKKHTRKQINSHTIIMTWNKTQHKQHQNLFTFFHGFFFLSLSVHFFHFGERTKNTICYLSWFGKLLKFYVIRVWCGTNRKIKIIIGTMLKFAFASSLRLSRTLSASHLLQEGEKRGGLST